MTVALLNDVVDISCLCACIDKELVTLLNIFNRLYKRIAS